MSVPESIVDAILAHIAAAVPGATTRNAIPQGFVDESQVSANDFPFWQGFGVTAEVEAGDFGQKQITYEATFWGLRGANAGAAQWADLEAIIAAVEADHELGGIVSRVWAGEFGVDEVTNRGRRTLAGVTFAARLESA